MELPKVNDAINKRLVEIKFYLIIKILEDKFKNHHRDDFNSLIQALCQVYDVKYTHINYVMQLNTRVTHQPTVTEVIVASKYLKIPVRKLNSIMGISNTTYYNLYNAYKEDGMPILMGKYDNDQQVQMALFIKGFQQMFHDIEVIL